MREQAIMEKLKPDDLMTLEEYHEQRPEFRKKAVAHKEKRKVYLGPNATLFFEDRVTMQYQVQEVIRAEKIFKREEIEDELSAYNPLIPDGRNLKATFMLEYDDREERQRKLAQFVGIEDTIWVRVGEHDKVYPIADEDMERDTAEKTSSVHFLRFEFGEDMIRDARNGAPIGVGIDFDAYNHSVDPLPEETRQAIAEDFE